MPLVEERIEKIEQKLSSHEMLIEQLEKSIEEQKRTSAEILDKLNRLVYRDEGASSTFDHHKLLCKSEFDNRYICKSAFGSMVEKVIELNGEKKIDNAKSASYIIKNSIDILWKVIIICGGVYGLISLLGA